MNKQIQLSYNENKAANDCAINADSLERLKTAVGSYAPDIKISSRGSDSLKGYLTAALQLTVLFEGIKSVVLESRKQMSAGLPEDLASALHNSLLMYVAYKLQHDMEMLNGLGIMKKDLKAAMVQYYSMKDEGVPDNEALEAAMKTLPEDMAGAAMSIFKPNVIVTEAALK